MISVWILESTPITREQAIRNRQVAGSSPVGCDPRTASMVAVAHRQSTRSVIAGTGFDAQRPPSLDGELLPANLPENPHTQRAYKMHLHANSLPWGNSLGWD